MLDSAVRAVAARGVARPLAAAKGNGLACLAIYDHGAEFASLMGAVAEWLLLAQAASAPRQLSVFFHLVNVG